MKGERERERTEKVVLKPSVPGQVLGELLILLKTRNVFVHCLKK